MTYRTRRRLAILILVLGLPAYIVAAMVVLSLFDRPHVLVELVIYVALGVVWAIPFRRVFLGVGRADPEARERPGSDAP